MAHKVTATFRDYWGDKATCVLQGGTTLRDAEQWGEALAKYSRAALIAVSHVESKIYPTSKSDAEGMATTLAGEHYDSVKQKCKLLYRDNDTTGRIFNRSVQIPAPNDNCFGANQEPKSDLGEDIADAIANSSTTERGNLQYMGGGLVSKLNKRRQAVVTGV